MPITLKSLLNQCGTTESDAPFRDIGLDVLRDTLPALLSGLADSQNIPPDALRGLRLLCAADVLRRVAAVPGSQEPATIGGIQIGRGRLPEMADTFTETGDALLRPYRAVPQVILSRPPDGPPLGNVRFPPEREDF